MKYPSAIFKTLPEKRRLQIIRRFADRLEEKNIEASQGQIVEELECYLGQLEQPLQWESGEWHPRTLDHLQCQIEGRLGLSSRDDQLRVLRGDKEKRSDFRLPLKVILHDLRSAFNIGAIFRSAECVAIDEIIISGYTPRPTHPSVKKTVMGTLSHVRWSSNSSIESCIENEKKQGRIVYALETVEGAPSIYQASLLEKPLTLVLGNERFGLESEVLQLCDGALQIPVLGVKNSLNVANAFSVCAYEILRQWQEHQLVSE